MPRPARLGARTVKALLAVTLVFVAGLAVALNTVLASGGGGGPLNGGSIPTLYPDAALGVVGRLVPEAERRADGDARTWLATHPVRDDTGFANFAITHIGPPPSGAAQRRELAQLHSIDAGRTAAGAATSTWLETHGKKDVWKLYLKQYRQQVPHATGDRATTAFKATYGLAKAIENTAKAKFARPSPYITDPTLHAVNQSRFAKKFSYPSKHAVTSYAEATLLTHLEPHRGGEYRWMASEIAYSRLYAGGHYPSDVGAGIYLGRLIADYELGARR